MVGRFGQERNSASGRKLGKQSVWVQTISNPQVAGSNPAGRAKNLTSVEYANSWIFEIKCIVFSVRGRKNP